jgi:hypothetical protein
MILWICFALLLPRNAHFILDPQQIFRYNNRVYEILGLSEKTMGSRFRRTNKITKKEEEISFYDYYREAYPNVKIRDNHQVLFRARRSGRGRQDMADEIIYLVPELCRPAGL